MSNSLMTHQEKSNYYNEVNNNDHGYGNRAKQVADMHLESLQVSSGNITSYFLWFSAKAQDGQVVGLGCCEGTLA